MNPKDSISVTLGTEITGTPFYDDERSMGCRGAEIDLLPGFGNAKA